jgi:hypothetical protein
VYTCASEFRSWASKFWRAALFTQGTFRDPRVRAIAPISPQGPGQFGSFNRSPADNTWVSVDVPAFTLVGGAEKDGSEGGDTMMTDWRLFPYFSYRLADHFLAVIPGQNHSQMGNAGSAEVNDFVAKNTRLFFEVYLRDAPSACAIGTLASITDTDLRRMAGEQSSRLAGCP